MSIGSGYLHIRHQSMDTDGRGSHTESGVPQSEHSVLQFIPRVTSRYANTRIPVRTHQRYVTTKSNIGIIGMWSCGKYCSECWMLCCKFSDIRPGRRLWWSLCPITVWSQLG